MYRPILNLLIALLSTSLALAQPITPHQDFIHQLAPQAQKACWLIQQQRNRILSAATVWHTQHKIGPKIQHQIEKIAHQYQLKNWHPKQQQAWQKLKSRVDVWPISLVLSQAAIESAWGRSRFAQQGHNLFGLWCYRPGCGIVPNRRNANQSHEVQKFANNFQSVQRYLWTLNTHAAYHKLRTLRAQMRNQSQPLSSLKLSQGLTHYSALGAQYSTLIKHIIVRHNLKKWDTA